MPAIVEFLFPSPAARSTASIVSWWERRRLPYNLIVGASGLFSLAVVQVVTWMPGAPPGMLDWRPVVVFGVGANVCYFLGPLVEVAIARLWGRKVLPTGPTLYRMGLTFSVGLALFPALLVTLFWLARVVLLLF
jgi:hypothetical protein